MFGVLVGGCGVHFLNYSRGRRGAMLTGSSVKAIAKVLIATVLTPLLYAINDPRTERLISTLSLVWVMES
jgi:hypothetical protein